MNLHIRTGKILSGFFLRVLNSFNAGLFGYLVNGFIFITVVHQ